MITITRKLEFDAGHRIPDHKSQCRNLHGHRYVLEITLQGEVIEQEGNSDNGMIMDFSDVKSLPNHKTVVIDRIPTVENLGRTAFDILKAAFIDRYGTGLKLQKLVLHETPNCWAEITEAE